MTVPVVILAGGLASRLGPIAATVPKSLIVVAGQPFISHQLRLLRRQGIGNVVLCVGYLGEKIRDYVGSGDEFGIEVAYSFDGNTPLGTGGALRRALPLLGETFIVLYGDSYLDVPLDPIMRQFYRIGLPAMMSIFRNEDRWDTSNVLFDGTRVLRHDKQKPSAEMRYIDYGLGVLTASALAGEQANSFDLSDAYARLAAEGRLGGYEVTQRFYEIGSPDGLQETDRYLRASRDVPTRPRD
jgi:N-acetyl-alpha-D-muramate 1-phosphate uridylyltransferase